MTARRTILTLIAGASIMIAFGCTKTKDTFSYGYSTRPSFQETSPEPDLFPTPEPACSPEPAASPEPAYSPMPAMITSPSPEPGPDASTSPKPLLPEDKSIDFDELNGLSTKKYSWNTHLCFDTDQSGGPTYIQRLMKKYNGIYMGDPSSRAVYLTFDEGYEAGYSASILDTLKKNDVKAVFFITGFYMRDNEELVKRMLEEGHVLGSHTQNHLSLPEVENDRLASELLNFEKRLYEKFGVGFSYMRPPYGDFSEKTLACARKLGYKTVMWSFAYRDYDVNDQKGADHAYESVMSKLHNGAVILLHAVSRDNAEALDRIIHGIREKGYEILPFNF